LTGRLEILRLAITAFAGEKWRSGLADFGKECENHGVFGRNSDLFRRQLLIFTKKRK
jgi:hypothetical protein